MRLLLKPWTLLRIEKFQNTIQLYDIGALHEHVSKKEFGEWVNKPLYIPPDVTGQAFPFSLFMKRRPNGEKPYRVVYKITCRCSVYRL